MNWAKFKEPYRAGLIHEAILEDDGGIVASASKDDPVSGTITSYRIKKVGRNKVKMYRFYPDAAPDKSWELSSKWFQGLRKAG